MRPNITISIPEPFLPLDEYCRRHGISMQTARDMIADGRLPVRQKDPTKKRAKVFVNMFALTLEAASHSHLSLDTK